MPEHTEEPLTDSFDVFEQVRYCDMCEQTTNPLPTPRGDLCSNCSCYYEVPSNE